MEKGLYGAMIVRAADELELDAEKTLVFDDLHVDKSGQIAKFGGLTDRHSGRAGNVRLNNRTSEPEFTISGGADRALTYSQRVERHWRRPGQFDRHSAHGTSDAQDFRRAASHCLEVKSGARRLVPAQVSATPTSRENMKERWAAMAVKSMSHSRHASSISASAICRFAGVILLGGALLRAQAPATLQVPLTDRERALLDRIEALERRVAALEGKPTTATEAPRSILGAAATPAAANVQSEAATKAGFLGLPGTTLNFYLDGYYGWNFNRPVGRVSLLRANDVLANNFTLNQIGLILERAPDVDAGRRYGGRVDLMFGQNTETMQGGAQNEPRPQVYRNIFQAYGTYVFPVGSGLTVDFGKFYSSLGFENNYSYDEINYSRAFYYNYLPSYHMGLRTTYNVNDRFSIQHWLVNGANQTEDFNGYKSNAFLFTIKPSKSVSWNVNYFFGQENRDLQPAYNPTVPPLPTQPGLSVTPVPGKKMNGRTHIFDTYASWSPSSKVTVAGEFDYIVSRLVTDGPPKHVIGGVGYLQYHFTPKFSLAGRVEYLQDHGGLFSGATQNLKEHTVTATYQFIDGFQMRIEHRRDFSNQPFFLTEMPGVLKKEQNTATVGLVWWFGGKRESW